MKKLRTLLLVLFAAVMVATVPLAVACSKDEEKTLQSITLNTDNAKKDYLYGEAFSSEGIIVTANYLTVKKGREVSEDVSELVTYETSALNNLGEGSVSVSYTYEEVTCTESFTVNVIEYGLSVTVPESVKTEFTLTAENTTASISDVISGLVVKATNVAGDSISTLGTNDYTVTVYNKTAEVSVSDYTKLAGGVYQVWAQQTNGNYSPKAFVLVYVIDPIESISFNSEEATLTQVAGNTDEMSPTWTFTATYASGATKDLTIDDVTVEGLDTKTAVTDAKATITYTDVDAKGTETNKTCEVTYTVTAKQTSGGAVANRLLEIDATTWSYTADTDLKQTDFTGDKAFLTVLSGTVKYRPGQSKGCVEIKGDALQFTVEGSCTLKLACYSTGSSNVSDIAVKDANGKYIVSTTPDAVADTNAEGYYTVTGTGTLTVLEFDLEAGTYTLTSCCDSTNDAPHNRTVRIKTIQIVGSSAASNFSVAVDATTWSYAADTDLKQSDMTGNLEFLTILSGSTVKYRPTTSKGCIEIKGDALQFTVEGSGTLKLDVASTGGSNVSDIAIKDADGNYVVCITEGAVADTNAEGYYTVTGTDITSLQFELEAGTYIITACCDSTDGAPHNRTVRIKNLSFIAD